MIDPKMDPHRVTARLVEGGRGGSRSTLPDLGALLELKQ